MLRRCLCMLAMLLLAACAAPRQIDLAKTASIRSIAVLVLVNDTFWIGSGREGEEIEPDWGISRLVHNRLVESLQDRYEVRPFPFPYDMAALLNAHTSTDSTLGYPKGLTEALKKVARPGAADAILVLRAHAPGSCASFFRGRFGPEVTVYFTIDMFDGNTLDPIGEHYAVLPDRRSILGENVPYKVVDAAWRGEPYAAISATLQHELRATVEDLIERSIPYTLARMKLIDPVPGS